MIAAIAIMTYICIRSYNYIYNIWVPFGKYLREFVGGYNIWQFVEIMDLARY